MAENTMYKGHDISFLNPVLSRAAELGMYADGRIPSTLTYEASMARLQSQGVGRNQLFDTLGLLHIIHSLVTAPNTVEFTFPEEQLPERLSDMVNRVTALMNAVETVNTKSIG